MLRWTEGNECIALYGSILNAYVQRPECSAEMFFDRTPGTPPIYRRDLLYKLFHVGYDVPHNILFGTACSTGDYNSAWAREWLARGAVRCVWRARGHPRAV